MDVKKAVILAGGLGERLRPLTLSTPKSLVNVHGRTLIEHLLDLFKKHGIKDIYISVGYLGEKIIDYFGDGSKFGVKITFFHEKERLGTAGCLRFFKEHLNETFILTNGDELKELDLKEMEELHKINNSRATIALWEVEDPSKYGVADLDGERIAKFVEKPKKEEAPSNFISSGLYILDPEVVDMVKPGYCMFETDIFPRIAEASRLYGYKFRGQWFDTGNIERLEKARKEWKDLK
ncbi:MAG: nucleotidyltransferase family protein [Candidatus Woesearchaeota archaeon]